MRPRRESQTALLEKLLIQTIAKCLQLRAGGCNYARVDVPTCERVVGICRLRLFWEISSRGESIRPSPRVDVYPCFGVINDCSFLSVPSVHPSILPYVFGRMDGGRVTGNRCSTVEVTVDPSLLRTSSLREASAAVGLSAS